MLKISTLLLVLVARAHAVVPEITRERLIRLELNGHVSHLFVTGDVPLDPRHREVLAAYTAFDQSCDLYLAGPSAFDRPFTIGPRVAIADHLSTSARVTLKDLGIAKLLNRAKPVSVERVWRAVRASVLNYRLRQVSDYLDYVGRVGEFDFDVNLEMRALATFLRDHPFTDRELHAEAERLIDRNFPRVDVRQELIKRRPKPPIYLDGALTAPAAAPDLNRLLAKIRTILDRETPTEAYVNEAIAAYVEILVGEAYFVMDPTTLAVATKAMSRSGLFSYSTWPGEDAVVEQDLKRSETWVETLVSALSRGPIFIGLDARYVFTPEGRGPSLLERLNDRGVRVTPISAHRHKLRAI